MGVYLSGLGLSKICAYGTTLVHTKPIFNDTMKMERLKSVFQGEIKKEIVLTRTSSMFYATALKTLKKNMDIHHFQFT